MKSKTFFYNKGLFKNNLKMYSVISILWGILLFLTHAFPMMIRDNQFPDFEENFEEIAYYHFLPNVTYFMALGVGMIFGFVLFYFLKKDNGIAFHFSLPITKIQIFNSQFLVALVLGLAPVLLNSILMAGTGLLQIPAKHSGIFLTAMGLWTWNLMMVFIIGFFVTTAIGVITGSVLWQMVFVGIFYVLPYYIFATIDFLGSQLLLGYTGNQTLEEILLNSSLLSAILYSTDHTLDYLALYLLIYAVVVGIIAFFLYKYKPMESNREWIAFNFMKVIFVIGFTYCFSLLSSMFFYGVLIQQKSGVYAGAAIGAMIGYVIAMMIARKTIYLKKAWLGTLVAAVVAFAFVMGVDTDVLGFERYIPKAEDVAKVEVVLHSDESFADDPLSQLVINDNYDYIKQPYNFSGTENIKQVMNIHQQIIDSNPNPKSGSNMQIRYYLKNGKKFERYYRHFEVPDMENNYQSLLSSSEALEQRYSILDQAEVQLITGIKVQREQDSIEENFTGKNMKELIAIIQEQIKSSAENPEEVEIHADEDSQVLQLKQPVIRIAIEQKEKEKEMEPRDTDDYTREYKEKSANVYNLVFTGKAENLRNWLKAHSSIKVDESIEVDQIESISLMEEGYFYGINNDIIYGRNISEEVSNENTWVVDSDRQNFSKYLHKAGLPMSGRENVILKIQMENGFVFYRAMTSKDFQQIKNTK